MKFKNLKFMVYSSILILMSCNAQIDKQKSNNITNSATVSDQITPVTASINSGEASGSKVIVQPGQLSLGSSIDINAVTAPNEFQNLNLQAASAPIQVTAKDKDNNPIISIPTPMTIAIPVDENILAKANLNLAEVNNNLCVLLKSDKGLFTFRPNEINVITSEKKVTISSKLLGIFQVVVCEKQEELAGFKEKSESKELATADDFKPSIGTLQRWNGDKWILLTAEDPILNSQPKNKNLDSLSQLNLTNNQYIATGSQGELITKSLDNLKLELGLNQQNTQVTTMSSLTDVDVTNLQSGQLLKWNGTKWAGGNESIADTIADGIVNVAVSQNAVFDALSLKLSNDVIDINTSLGTNDNKVASQKATKIYIDNQISSVIAGSGGVSGAPSSLDNALVRFDGSTGKLIQNSSVILDDNGNFFKNSIPFLHSFNYGNNGTVTTDGANIFVGENSGNISMGSTATLTYHASNNTGVGKDTLKNTTTGFFNTAIGAYSGSAITTGNNNTVVGGSSLSSLSSGNSNVAIGGNTLGSLTTGFSNIAIGNLAGTSDANNNGISSNNNSVYLGTGTKSKQDGTNNEIVLGSNATGNGSNTVTIGNDAIIATYLKGYIKLKDNDSNFLAIKASDNLVNDMFLIFPSTTGTNGQVLKTDGSGNLFWANDLNSGGGANSIDSTAIVDGTIVNSDISNSAAIDQSKILGLASSLANKQDTITTGSTTQYFRGDLSRADFATDVKLVAIGDTLTDAITDKAPSQNAVFDALALKQNLITSGSSIQYLKGDLTLGIFTTDVQNAAVADTLNDSITNIAPSQNAVFDSISTVSNKIGTLSNGKRCKANGGKIDCNYDDNMPGQIAEVLAGECDGRTVDVLSGSYTLANVTTPQTFATTYSDLNCSNINYIPPTGVKTVIYEFKFHVGQIDPDGLGHMMFFIDNIEVTSKRSTFRSPTGDIEVIFKAVIAITGTDNLPNAQVESWDLLKNLKLQIRNFSPTYEVKAFETNYFDGAASLQISRPNITITAIY